MDAISKFIWAAESSVFVIVFQGAYLTLALLLQGVLVMALARIPRRAVSAGLSLPTFLALVLILTRGAWFPSGSRVVFGLGPLAFSNVGLEAGISLGARLIVIAMTALISFVWTTRPRELIGVFNRLGLPHSLSYSVYVSLRFLPMMQSELENVKAARAIRGGVHQSLIKKLINVWRSYLFVVVVNSLRKGETLATAMSIRGFGGKSPQTSLEEWTWSRSGVTLVMATVAYQTLLLSLLPFRLAPFNQP